MEDLIPNGNQQQSLEQVLPEDQAENTLSQKLKKYKKERLMKEFKRKNPTKQTATKPLMQL